MRIGGYQIAGQSELADLQLLDTFGCLGNDIALLRQLTTNCLVLFPDCLGSFGMDPDQTLDVQRCVLGGMLVPAQ